MTMNCSLSTDRGIVIAASSSSQVIDALQSEAGLERLLDALGCQPDAPVSEGLNIRCPMPDHPDENPSCTVRAKMGMFHCQTLCGQLLPLDLVIAHGHASDRGEAARWIESKFNIAPRPADAPPIRKQEPVDDPSLTVAQMLGMLGLPDSTRSKFHLEDVRSWHAGDSKLALYETGMYTSVLIPYSLDIADDGPLAGRPLCLSSRARVRSCAPGSKLKWANRTHRFDLQSSPPRLISKRDLSMIDGKTPIEHGGYGLPWLEAMPPSDALRHHLLVVEGESDVWAAHAMGFTAVIGVPGAKNGKRAAADIAEAVLIVGGGSSADVQVAVWQEPDAAGAGFPAHVSEHAARELADMGMPAPMIRAVRGAALHGGPKDMRSLWQMSGEGGLEVLRAALLGGPEDTPAVDQSAAALPMPADPAPKPRATGGEPWESATFDDAPDLDHVARISIECADRTFCRVESGWSVETLVKRGDEFVTSLKAVCSPFVITKVEASGDDQYVTIAAPRVIAGAASWQQRRVKTSTFASSERGSALLISMGVQPWSRQKQAMLDLALVLSSHVAQVDGIHPIAAGTGWTGTPGDSEFSGIECECLDELPQMMFEANQARRERQPDEHAAAAEWWEKVAAPLTSAVDSPMPCHAAPLIALGAAAAAPLLGPLTLLGVEVSPVAWLSGLGGGGKTVTLAACASIYAPKGSQGSFRSGADMSRAALDARAAYSRDLPFLLDDVTQVPALAQTKLRGEAAKVEAAAHLAMAIFNRSPTERATREGAVRLTKPYRSTALFTAEATISREIAPTVTAGHLRRVSALVSQPMTDRGLPRAYADVVADQSALNGGAPGTLLVQHIRSIVAANDLRPLLKSARKKIMDLDPAMDVDQTQKESLAVSVMGYSLLAEACGAMSRDEALEHAVHLVSAYITSSEGGALKQSMLEGHEAALDAVKSMITSNGIRFLSENAADDAGKQLAEVLGKIVRRGNASSKERWAILLPTAMYQLKNSKYGVTEAQITAAVDHGIAQRSVVANISGTSVRGMAWLIGEPDIEDHDHDPESPSEDTYRYPSEMEEDTHRLPDAQIYPSPAFDVSEASFKLRLPHGAVMDDEDAERGMASFRWSDGMYERGDEASPASDHDQVRREARAELDALREAFAADKIEVADPPADDEVSKWSKLDELGPHAPARLWEKCRVVGIKLMDPDLEATDAHALKVEHVRLYRIILMLRMRRPEWFIDDHAE